MAYPPESEACLFVVFVVLKRCTCKYTFFYARLKVVRYEW
jgi:hypothetical protein